MKWLRLFLAVAVLAMGANAHAFDGPRVHGDLPGPGPGGVYVVRTADEWQRLTDDLNLEASAPDFNHFMALVITAGTRNTGGFKVDVLEHRSHDWFFEVTYAVTPPSATDMVIQMITNPYVIAFVPQDGAPVAFTKGNFGQVEMPQSEFMRLTHRFSALTYEHQDTQRRLEYTQTQLQEVQRLIERLRHALPQGGEETNGN